LAESTLLEEREFQTEGVTIIAATHAVHDTYPAFLPALLPLLIEKLSLSNTAAGLMTVFYQIPSLLQPLIGRLADKKNLRPLIVLAPTLTGMMISSLGIVSSYGFALFLLVLAGLSSSLLHATGPVLISTLSGNRLGHGMSFWMVGGEIGRVLGPVVTVTAVAYLSLEGLPWLVLAGLMTSVFLHFKLNDISTKVHKETEHLHWREGLLQLRKMMLPLAVIIFFNNLSLTTLTNFLPTYLTRQGTSLWMAGFSLTILETAGVIGAFLAGGLSDKFGRRRLLTISYLVTPILIVLFVSANGVLQIPLLMLLGFFIISTTPVIMAIVLENAPEQRAFANGVYMATNSILHALAILLVGFIADRIDLRFTFLLSAGLLPLCILFVRLLPKPINR